VDITQGKEGFGSDEEIVNPIFTKKKGGKAKRQAQKTFQKRAGEKKGRQKNIPVNEREKGQTAKRQKKIFFHPKKESPVKEPITEESHSPRS